MLLNIKLCKGDIMNDSLYNTILKQVIEKNRIYIRDYFNNELSEDALLIEFSLQKCDRCDNYELEEDLLLSNNNDYICEQCQNDI